MIIEDSDDDFEAIERALNEGSTLANPILRFESGREAMEYLAAFESSVSVENLVLPTMILLDLNLPGMNGQEVLAKIKNDDFLCRVPVIVLTMSANQSDIDECYRLGANTYIEKPLDLDEFFSAIASFKDYWLNIALLPELDNR